jgi:glycosyltransferase 2 family protein
MTVSSGAVSPRQVDRGSSVPQPVTAWVVATLSSLAVLASYWLAVQSGAADAQAAFATWINDPPQPLGAVLAATNSLFRPLPLAAVSLGFIGWTRFTSRAGSGREMVRAAVMSVALAEVVTQTLKRVANQTRPTASIPGLDVHGYPKDPFGNAYPSAHTSVAVALVAALWPWLTWPQRVVGVATAALVALNRMYIGAHWPVDVIGGVAVGLLAGSLCWLVAWRWPLRRAANRSTADSAG